MVENRSANVSPSYNRNRVEHSIPDEGGDCSVLEVYGSPNLTRIEAYQTQYFNVKVADSKEYAGCDFQEKVYAYLKDLSTVAIRATISTTPRVIYFLGVRAIYYTAAPGKTAQ
jgi:hypothetical protein